MTNYPNQRTDRIDTTITEVAVQRGDTSSALSAAAKFVTDRNPGAHVLAIWSARVRDDHGNPVFNVEWEDATVVEEMAEWLSAPPANLDRLRAAPRLEER